MKRLVEDLLLLARLDETRPVQRQSVNCVAADSAELIDKVAAAVSALRDAQAAAFDEGGRSDLLREAVGVGRSVGLELRQVAEGVLRRAQRPKSDVVALAMRVNEAMANSNLLEQLRIGHLGMRAVEDADPFAGMPEPKVRSDVQVAAAKPRVSTKSKPAAVVVDAEVELRKARAIKSEQARLAATSALVTAKSELESAEGEYDGAVEILRAAEAEIKRTEKRLAAAQASVEEAERSLHELTADS